MNDPDSGWSLRRYSEADATLWDEFCASSRNATFLLHRPYMDYHSDRFVDASLVATLRGRVAALLPAEVTVDGTLRSHGGLTYGGWILPAAHTDCGDVLALFRLWTDWCRRHHMRRIDYRPLPAIYHRAPSQDDIYALFRMGAVQYACAVSSTIDYASFPGLSSMRRRHLRRASRLGAVINEAGDAAPFHAMLTECLRERHDTRPVHTLDELELLRFRFPQNIKIYTIDLEGTPQAGVCMYLTDRVAHAQYIATTPKGRELCLLTPLMTHLIELFSATHRYFDFGISTEDDGLLLNTGLLRQKTSFGATPTVCQRFMLEL